MSDRSYPLNIGDIRCLAVSDAAATRVTSVGGFSLQAPIDKLNAALCHYGATVDEMPLEFNCLLIESGGQRALVDAGSGPTPDEPDLGKLPAHLRAIGIAPADIDVVVISHMHWDHLGGAFTAEDKPVFPKARYLIGRADWEHWLAAKQPAADEASFNRTFSIGKRALKALRDRVTLVEGGMEVIPGVRIVAAPGHTPGHLAVAVRSQGQGLLFVGDAIYHPIQIDHPDWCSLYDSDRAQAEKTKRKLLDLAAGEGMLLMLAHGAPLPGIGRVRRSSAGWQWRPL